MIDNELRVQLMRDSFPAHQIGKLAKGSKAQMQCPATEKKNCSVCGGWHHPKLVHLDFVGHAALTDRLLDVDPMWSWEPLAFGPDGLPLFDASGGLWIKLTVCGITRLGYGNAEESQYKEVGSREKEVIGDALRNAAMRFGAALELWHKGDLHITDDAKDPLQEQKNRGIEDLEKEAILLDERCSAFDSTEDFSKIKAELKKKYGTIPKILVESIMKAHKAWEDKQR